MYEYSSILVFSLLCTRYTINTYAARPSAEASEALRIAAKEERPQGATTRFTVHSSVLCAVHCRKNICSALVCAVGCALQKNICSALVWAVGCTLPKNYLQRTRLHCALQ
jgi:hypothetical protein